jgi:hypothetical protein
LAKSHSVIPVCSSGKTGRSRFGENKLLACCCGNIGQILMPTLGNPFGIQLLNRWSCRSRWKIRINIDANVIKLIQKLDLCNFVI